MSANGVPEAVTGTFELLGKLDNPYIAVIFLICIGIVLFSLFGCAAAFYFGRQDKKEADARYDALVKSNDARMDALVSQTKAELREMHTANLASDKEMNATLQGLGQSLQTLTSIVTAIATRPSNGG